MKRPSTLHVIFTVLLLLSTLLGCSASPSEPVVEWRNATQVAGKAAGLSHIAGLVIDGPFAYVTMGGTLADQQAGTSGLRRVALASGEVTVLDNGDELPQAEAGGLVADEQFVYWNGGGKIWRMPKTMGAAEVVAAEHVGIGIDLAVDNTKLYWANHQYYAAGTPATPSPIYAMPKGGGAVEMLADQQETPHSLLVDKNFIYWLTPTTIVKQAKAGGSPQIVHQAGPGEGVDTLAQDDEYLYFGFRAAGASHWALRKVAKSGGEAQTLVNRYALKAVVVDQTYVYFFAENGLSSDALCKVTKSGGKVTILDSGYASGLLAQDKTQLYFAALDDLYRLTK